MTDAIKPALTASQWHDKGTETFPTLAKFDATRQTEMGPIPLYLTIEDDEDAPTLRVGEWYARCSFHIPTDALAPLIALANAAIPDGHPQKLTWAMVDAIRSAVDHFSNCEAEDEIRENEAMAAASNIIESLLPPREAKTNG